MVYTWKRNEDEEHNEADETAAYNAGGKQGA